ncbi:MAG: ABC transporter permease, partial [Planctomycetia bacterium]
LALSVVIGLIHGLLVTKVRLQPFVVTLCGLLIYRGIARWITGDATMGFGNQYDGLRSLVVGKLAVGGGYFVPYPVFLLLGLAVLATIFLNATVWGRYMYAVGRNEQAARYSGVDTHKMIILSYVLCSLCAGIGGVLFALNLNSVQPSSQGNFDELYAIAAAVLGGCSLRGGEGGILGAIIGTALFQVLYNAPNLLSWPTQLEFTIIGAAILAGVIADEAILRWRARRGTA